MRFSSTTCLFLIITMFVGLSCYNKVEIKPDEDDYPGYLPLPPINRLIKRTYKSVILEGPVVEPEQVEVERGQTFTVGIKEVTTYTYDEQGRLVGETIASPSGYSIKTNFKYQGDKIHSHKIRTSSTASPYITFDTIQLDARGLAFIQADKVEASFDEQGNAVRLKGNGADESIFVEDGNPVQRTIRLGGGEGNLIFSQTFDGKLRNRQPDPYPYTGRKSRNLENKSVMEVSESVVYPNGYVYKIESSYTLDKYGRIDKLISFGQKLNPYWLFEFSNKGIGIYHMEYASN